MTLEYQSFKIAGNVLQICVRCLSALAWENGANVLLALVALRWL